MIPIYWNGSLLSPANKYIDGNDHRSLLSSNQSFDGIINTTLNSARSSSIPVCLFPSTRRVIDAGNDSDQNMDIPKYRLFFLNSGGRGKDWNKGVQKEGVPDESSGIYRALLAWWWQTAITHIGTKGRGRHTLRCNHAGTSWLYSFIDIPSTARSLPLLFPMFYFIDLLWLLSP